MSQTSGPSSRPDAMQRLAAAAQILHVYGWHFGSTAQFADKVKELAPVIVGGVGAWGALELLCNEILAEIARLKAAPP